MLWIFSPLENREFLLDQWWHPIDLCDSTTFLFQYRGLGMAVVKQILVTSPSGQIKGVLLSITITLSTWNTHKLLVLVTIIVLIIYQIISFCPRLQEANNFFVDLQFLVLIRPCHLCLLQCSVVVLIVESRASDPIGSCNLRNKKVEL